MKWTESSQELPPKDKTFLFRYDMGYGIGAWDREYIIVNGNSELLNECYVLINVTENYMGYIDPYFWNDEKMIKMNIKWTLFPEK